MESRPSGARWSCVQPAAARYALALLTRQPVLIAVTFQTWIAGSRLDVTVNKVLDEAGAVLPQYWWDVDRLTDDGRGNLIRVKRWALGLHSYATAEGAYQAAVQAAAQSDVAPPDTGPC